MIKNTIIDYTIDQSLRFELPGSISLTTNKESCVQKYGTYNGRLKTADLFLGHFHGHADKGALLFQKHDPLPQLVDGHLAQGSADDFGLVASSTVVVDLTRRDGGDVEVEEAAVYCRHRGARVVVDCLLVVAAVAERRGAVVVVGQADADAAGDASGCCAQAFEAARPSS